MLKTIRTFLADLAHGEGHHRFNEDDHRLAAAALLHHVVAIDGTVTERERAALRAILQRRYELGPQETEQLMQEAADADNEAVDLFGFTNILKRRLDEDGRERIVAMMWELVYSDGNLHEFEDNVIWRVAELLGVSSRARIRLKKAIQSGGHADD